MCLPQKVAKKAMLWTTWCVVEREVRDRNVPMLGNRSLIRLINRGSSPSTCRDTQRNHVAAVRITNCCSCFVEVFEQHLNVLVLSAAMEKSQPNCTGYTDALCHIVVNITWRSQTHLHVYLKAYREPNERKMVSLFCRVWKMLKYVTILTHWSLKWLSKGSQSKPAATYNSLLFYRETLYY